MTVTLSCCTSSFPFTHVNFIYVPSQHLLRATDDNRYTARFSKLTLDGSFYSIYGVNLLLLQVGVMHLSFASLAPRYPSTSGDHSHTCSIEADESSANIHRLPRRAGRLWHWVADKVPALIPRENPEGVPAQIPGPNDHHQAKATSPYMFPAGRDVNMHKSPALSWRVPHYCLGTRGLGIQMIGA